MKSSMQEDILVIKQEILFKNISPWHGVNQDDTQSIIELIVQHQESMVRAQAETDAAYKQIISYMAFTVNGKLFVTQRKDKPNEIRLANKLSIGIGGHMTQNDIQGETLFDWVVREFEEEVNYQGNLQMRTLGFLNDDSNEVGKVHLGLVILFQGEHENITIHGNEHKNGQLMSMQECFEKLDQFESWSQIVLKTLVE